MKRELLLEIAYAYGSNFINEQEFVLLYDCHKSTNPEFLYWNYDRFDLDEKSNEECKAEFRFYREDSYKLAEQLQLRDNNLAVYLWNHTGCFFFYKYTRQTNKMC